MHKIFKTKLFHRWMTKIDLDDKALCISVAEMHDGLIDANLGSNIYKKRVAIKGQGKRGAARTIVASYLEDRWFFIYQLARKTSSFRARMQAQMAKPFKGFDFKNINVKLIDAN